MTGRLVVHFGPRAVGDLRQRVDDSLEFAYRADWLGDPTTFPISLSLPLRPQPFDDATTRAWFEGFLPLAVGQEFAGSLSLHPPDEPPDERADDAPLRPLGDGELVALLRDPDRSPGHVRPLLAVVEHPHGLALPTARSASTHFVKVPDPAVEANAANEFFALELAAAVGIDAPKADLRQIDGLPFLLIERFDRRRNRDGTVRRLLREDVAQALGIARAAVHERDGGPGFAAMFGLLSAHSARGALDRLALLQRTLFSFLLGHANAHAQNTALVRDGAAMRLGPAFAMKCALVHGERAARLAMRIEDCDGFDDVTAGHWARFAATVGLAPPAVKQRLCELAATLPERARWLVERDRRLFAVPKLHRVVELLTSRCRRVLDSSGRR
ncbi:MAG: HipA domain-containing protein [Planctomycetes bacterium]|nr:HipA domain-containing protein [Planctomycetota bacterium]